jgi:hypothetical protein
MYTAAAATATAIAAIDGQTAEEAETNGLHDCPLASVADIFLFLAHP